MIGHQKRKNTYSGTWNFISRLTAVLWALFENWTMSLPQHTTPPQKHVFLPVSPMRSSSAFSFIATHGVEVTKDLLVKCAEVFSANYGIWGDFAGPLFQYFSLPHRFLQEWPDSTGIQWNPVEWDWNPVESTGIGPESSGIHRNGCIPAGMEWFDQVTPICDWMGVTEWVWPSGLA